MNATFAANIDAQKTLHALRLSNRALINAASEQELLLQICQSITVDDKYPLAWIAWTDSPTIAKLNIIASAGKSVGLLQSMQADWNALPDSPQKPIKLNKHPQPQNPPLLVNHVSESTLNTSLTIALQYQEHILGILVVYSECADAFQPGDVELFEELANNLMYGIQSRRLHQAYAVSMQESAQQTKKLEQVLKDALAAIAGVLEQRDPYTAGHQLRVAHLAVQIGQQLNLSEPQLQALYLSGIVHDLGKIQIPAEVLTKPSRLNAVEFALIKQHPEAAYHILKNIEFPWPIAELCYQHHEFLDGSGYPRGLKGEEILLEARILTVADIVESMSSDRPYRPALGISKAMQEITQMAQSKLDSQVVNACILVILRGKFAPNVLELD